MTGIGLEPVSGPGGDRYKRPFADRMSSTQWRVVEQQIRDRADHWTDIGRSLGGTYIHGAGSQKTGFVLGSSLARPDSLVCGLWAECNMLSSSELAHQKAGGSLSREGEFCGAATSYSERSLRAVGFRQR